MRLTDIYTVVVVVLVSIISLIIVNHGATDTISISISNVEWVHDTQRGDGSSGRYQEARTFS